MEGSRHERAALITTTYVIGFVTAFIAFGVTQLEDTVQFASVPAQSQPAGLAMSLESTQPTSVALMTDGLYYKNGTETLLISLLTSDSGDDGMAAVVSQYELSPTGDFVYFCEQPRIDSDACKPFVYSVHDRVVFPLTQDGQRIALTNVPEELSWVESGLSKIGDVTIDPLPAL